MHQTETDGASENEQNTRGASNITEFQGYFAQQISQEEFERQRRDMTASAVSELKRSPEYQQWYQRCSTCNSIWYMGQFNSQCQECGGFAMTRSCPICSGHCPAHWTRDVHMSHTFKEAYWNGKCKLPEGDQRYYMFQNLVEDSEDVLSQAMEDLGKT